MMETEKKNDFERKLVESGVLTQEQVAEASLKAGHKGISLIQYLLNQHLVAKTQAYEILAEVYRVPYVDVLNFQITKDAVALVPAELAHRYKIMPLYKMGGQLNIATENPAQVNAIDHIARKTQCEIEVCLAAASDIEAAIQQHYGSANDMTKLLDSLKRERQHLSVSSSGENKEQNALEAEIIDHESQKRPVIQLVELMLKQAHEEGASDIHVEPEEKMLRIRYRLDGVLHQVSTAPKEIQAEIISRIKILAQMNIAETRTPQDGRIKMMMDSKDVDMRVSSVPTVYGENIVIRILRDEHAELDLTRLGMNAEMRKTFETLITKPFGMILETGPTGSGKTTTLYAALSMINSIERNIVTIEDPVEYKLPLLRQIPVNVKAGLNFANALRSILRQDPDVIMVGEIRDRETAEIAIQAALTGHLVFSTLHTNTAVSAIARLADMRIEPFLIASSVVGIAAQRLVRRLCEKCREEDKPSDVMFEMLRVPAGKIKAFRGKGCRFCRETGFKGRIGIFELLRVDEKIQKLIVAGASSHEIEEKARNSGMKSMREDALGKIEAGLTTVEEVIKAVDLGVS